MPKYINVEDLGLTDFEIIMCEGDYKQALQLLLNKIESAPAADVVEVKHEYWIKQPPDFDLCGVAYYKCSGCGKEQQTPSRYCQFCMAKMDGGSTNERNTRSRSSSCSMVGGEDSW